jgi:hypothetical protein
MYFIYYWVTEEATGKSTIIRLRDFVGDIGEKFFYNGNTYIINDLSEEYEDFDEPEDF